MVHPKMTKTQSAASYTKRLQGLRNIPAKQVISIEGTAYTAAQVIGIFQATLDAMAALTAAEGQVKQARDALYGATAVASAVDSGLKQWAFGQYGSRSQQANDLG